jgi:hypothetical protein
VEVVGGGYHREENHEHASERQQTLQGGSAARTDTSAIPPEPIGRESQKKPRKIQQQFHFQKFRE